MLRSGRLRAGLLLGALLGLVFSARAQQAPETFRWVNFHSADDQSVVVWVSRSLEAEKWTAIREIGVQYDAALVVTTDRPTPQSPTSTDTFSVWSVSLTNHAVTSLAQGVNLRLLDWMLFSAGGPRELGALYEDCRECNATTSFTAFYYDIRVHGWSARWLRGAQAALLGAAHPPAGVAVTNVYALLADPNGHEMLATWSHFDYGKEKPVEDFLYEYDADPYTRLDRTQLIANKEAEALKLRLCRATDAISDVKGGQDSELCQETLSGGAARHKGRGAAR
ncbi:MAG: hypothetical protein P4L40_09930 [Terracidiphilus sp.]|nr:hypothetical protein [Terracidiphilus sp.]